MFCEKVGIKIWVCFESEVAQNNQSTAAHFLSMTNQNVEVSQLKPEDIHKNDVVLKPKLKFQYNDTMFRIEKIE